MKSGLYWLHCMDSITQNKFICRSDELWSPGTQIHRRGIFEPYLKHLPKSEFANALLVFMAGVIVVSYILYTVSPDVIERLNTQHLYLTAVFVILGITKYMQITFVEEDSGSPTKIFLKNKFLQITILSWLISFFLIVKI